MSQSKPTRTSLNKSANNLTLSSVLLLALAVCSCTFVASVQSEPGPQGNSGSDSAQSNEQIAPKRQYFIAPRVGRSQATSGQTRSIWSSLEEAQLMAPGQVQPIRGYPGPLRSSLMYLIGNRRLVGPRSPAGLLPQARIGRRASPSGLLPQPRVGRRSSGFEQQDSSDDAINELVSLDGGQQEIAVAATSDNAALNDAVESLLNGRPGLVCANGSNRPEGEIERPTSRASTAFVPRLGKRLTGNNLDGQRMDSLGRLVCATSPDCNQLVLLGALVSGLAVQESELNVVPFEDSFQAPSASSSFDKSNEDGLKLMRLLSRDKLLRRETRTSPYNNADELTSGSAASLIDTKRVAFTPRIGRRR